MDEEKYKNKVKELEGSVAFYRQQLELEQSKGQKIIGFIIYGFLILMGSGIFIAVMADLAD